MATEPKLAEIFCEKCGRPLAEYVNRIEAGSILIRRRCKPCKRMTVVTISAKTR